MKPITGKLTGIEAYRALLSLALEHKIYFVVAVIGMVIFALSEASFAYLMKPLLDEGFIDRDPVMVKLIPLAIIVIFAARVVAVFMGHSHADVIGLSLLAALIFFTHRENVQSAVRQAHWPSGEGA